jgi:ribosome recycling factor
MTLEQIYEQFKKGKEEAMEWLNGQVKNLRSNRVTTDLISGVQVEHYGARTPLVGLASISNADARTLVVQPWDAGAIVAIEKALTVADLGASPNVDGQLIRLVFATMTEEMKQKVVKHLHNHAEETRVRLRQARDEAVRALKQDKEKGKLTEDDFYNGREELDRMIAGANEEIEEIVRKKTGDITGV